MPPHSAASFALLLLPGISYASSPAYNCFTRETWSARKTAWCKAFFATCGANEEMKICGSCDSTCDDQRVCTDDCRKPACGCMEGFVRDGQQKCVLRKTECATQCGANEEIKQCGSCDSTCDDQRVCTDDCRKPACGCMEGFVRDGQQKCVLRKTECATQCGANEEMKICGSCDSTCDDQRVCTDDCRKPACGCMEGFVRDGQQKCVLRKTECATVPDPTCDNGVQNKKQDMCCSASCVTCGGKGCSKRPGGADQCCHGSIESSGRSCESMQPPCKLSAPVARKAMPQAVAALPNTTIAAVTLPNRSGTK